MYAFWLVLTYDLLEDRRIDDVIIKTFFNSLLYKTNRFQVTEQTHGNLESICNYRAPINHLIVQYSVNL